MKKIVITTESACDLPGAVREDYEIRTVSMHVFFNQQHFEDDEIRGEDVFRYYDEHGRLPTTSAVNIYEYQTFFESIQKEEPGCSILHIGYSSACSGCYSSLRAAVHGREDIATVDSLQVSGGLGMVALKAAEYYRAHPRVTLEELRKVAEEVKAHVHTMFVPHTLEYLRAGGRVSNFAALAAGMLKIYPVILIREGKLMASGKLRGKFEKVLKGAYELLKQGIENEGQKRDSFIIHADRARAEFVEKMKELVRSDQYPGPTELSIAPSMCVHGGPGAIGVVLYEC